MQSTRRRSNSESGHPRLNSTSINNDLVFNDSNMSNTRNNLSHQSQQIISVDMPASNSQEITISSKLENFKMKISNWQSKIDEENTPIRFEGLKNDHNVLKGDIHSLYQEVLYGRVTDKLSYDIIGLVALIDCVKQAAE